MTIDLIIKGATCVSHQGVMKQDIAVRDGIIVAIGDLGGDLGELIADEMIDASGLHAMPGVIDTDGEALEYPAAIRGGVTSLFSHGKIDELECPIDYARFVSVKNADRECEEGTAGLYIAMGETGDLDVVADDKSLHKVLKAASRRVVIHAEDQDQLNARRGLIEPGNVHSHATWRDEKSSINATRRILAIARGAAAQIHLAHVSSAKELAMIAAYKDFATVGLSPHHLFISAPDCYDHFREYAQIDPPIRDEENRIGLWKGLSSGIVDMVGSYHKAVSSEDKDLPYPNSKSGAPSVQTMLPLMLDQVNNGAMTLNALMDLTSAGPARAFNIAGKGRIAVGYDADFAFIDLKKEWTLDDDDVQSSCGWDHYAGCDFKGEVTGTMIRGQRALWQGELTGNTKGAPIRFQDTFQEFEDE